MRIQSRHSSTPGEVPAQLLEGEIAINTADRKLFIGSPTGTAIDVFTGTSYTLAELLDTPTGNLDGGTF